MPAPASQITTHPRRRPGGRTARVRDAVLAATLEELADSGYASLSIDAVARRSGIHKTTVYRRWPTREALVAETLDSRSGRMAPFPDTGSLRGDLITFGSAIVNNLNASHGRALVKTLVEAVDQSPELLARTRSFWRERLGMAADLVQRAIQRGELPTDTDPDFVIEGLIAPLYLRLLVTGEPLSRDLVERVVDLLLDGALRGGASIRSEPSPGHFGRRV
ncbi:MAG: TetR/AcrR family transcriptional regulator [Chloroflexota bacterium]|nr:TetR/AcrR family transcriptional regulator [Chloroflexota bacterium]